MRHMILALGMPGSWEWIIIVIIALLIFGRRLPDVARSVGKSIVEFKKGIRDVTEDIDDKSRLDTTKPSRLEPSTGSTLTSSTKTDAKPGGVQNDG